MTTTQNLLNGVTAQAASGKDLTQKIKVKVIDEAGNKVRVKQGNVTFDKAGTYKVVYKVTGNNKKYISDKKNNENERVLSFSVTTKYHINPTTNYIIFKPESFQQIAPTKMYRAQEKLLYRFISSQLVFAYDNKQTLSLNSCNIVIPRIPDIKMKYESLIQELLNLFINENSILSKYYVHISKIYLYH